MQIGAVRKKLLSQFGIDISIERLRRYEKWGLLTSHRNPKTGYRAYEPEEVKRVFKVILLIELGFSLDVIRRDNAQELASELRKKRDCLEYLDTLMGGVV